MQRRWVMAIIVASGLLAQTPTPEMPPTPVPTQAPSSKPEPSKPEPPKPEPPKPEPSVAAPAAEPKPAEMKVQETKPTEAKAAEPRAFDQLRPSQRKLAYTLHRVALAAHELGYYRGHAQAVEVREALEALILVKPTLPEKAQGAIPKVEAYLANLRAHHGLYDAEGKKLLMEGTWKELQTAARAAAKGGLRGLEPRLARLSGLLFDAKVDAVAPSWAAPEPPAKGKKTKAAKGPKEPEGFADQKAVLALWVRRAQAWIEMVPQEVEVQGVKKKVRLPDPVQTKALDGLFAWLQKDNLDLLRDPGFGWLDLRRLGAAPGAGLLARAEDIVASKAPEGAAGPLALIPTLEPVLGENRLGRGEEKRLVLAEVKQGPAPVNLVEQMVAFEKLGRSRELAVK